MTAARLAKAVGVSENAIRKIESGDSVEPRFSTGMRIANALAMSPNELVGGTVAGTGIPELAIVIRMIRAMRPDLESEGALHIDIFGSVARGNARETSDIDIIVTPKPDGRFSLLNLAAIGNQLEERLGRKVDLVTSNALASASFATDLEGESVSVF